MVRLQTDLCMVVLILFKSHLIPKTVKVKGQYIPFQHCSYIIMQIIILQYLFSFIKTVVLLLHPKINCMIIPSVVPVNSFRTIPLSGNFSNQISRIFLNHSSHWFKLNNVMQVLKTFSRHELNYRDGRGKKDAKATKIFSINFFFKCTHMTMYSF